jgi:hypothetical protein
MAIIGGTQFLERVQFFNGQRLFAQDLQTLESFNREMRWLHNQSLHQPGVGNGYGVVGNKGDRQVTVTPGYAIDACGREIVLTEAHIEPVPPVAGDALGNPIFYDLAVSYPNDSDLVESQTRQGICLPQGAVRLREAPNFCWIQLGGLNLQPVDPQLKLEVQSNMRIVLARAQIKNCQLYQPLSTAQRRNARQSTRPRIVCGSEGPGPPLKWTVVMATDASGKSFGWGVSADIDTSAARFQTPPCYSAYVMGGRFFTQGVGELSNQFVLDGWVNISSPSAQGFTIQLVMPNLENDFINPTEFFTGGEGDVNSVLAGNQWTVVWLGVES